MIYLTVFIGILVISVLLAPFWFGTGGLLQASSSINSAAQLEALQTAVLARYSEDEQAFQAGHLSKLAWQQRQSFLTNRYIDATRRLDFVKNARPAGGTL